MPGLDTAVKPKTATSAVEGGGASPVVASADSLTDPLKLSTLAEDAGLTPVLYETLLSDAAEAAGADAATVFSLKGGPIGAHPDQFRFPEGGDGDTELKTQSDPLPGLRPKHADKAYGDYSKHPAKVKGEGDAHVIDPNDVAQGALGDCYLLGSMAAVARANPKSIDDLIVDNGDGTFDVTLYIRDSYYGLPDPVTKTIDGRLPEKYANKLLYAKKGDASDGKGELWPALIEKTLAQHKGSYDEISGGNINKDGFKFAGGLELLTGKLEAFKSTDGMSADDAILEIGAALELKQPVTADSKSMSDDPTLEAEAKKYNVYGNHAYAPEKVDLDSMTMDLQNPWGSSHVKGLKAKDFVRFFRAIRIGG